MSDLDKKLNEILDDAFAFSNDHTISKEEAIPNIKQAFADAGYRRIFGDPVEIDPSKIIDHIPIRKELLNPEFVGPDTYPIDPKRTPEELKAISEELSKPRLTGKEWYDRFDREIRGRNFTNLNNIYDVQTTALMICEDAAKKAAGIK